MTISGISSPEITNLINQTAGAAAKFGTTGVSSTAAGAAASTASSTSGKTASTTNAFDTDTFMQLLLAELKNQDPLEPMNNSEMLGQMAQLNSLQKLTDISTDISSMKDYMELLLGISD